ncbi:MAG: hypothetical protein ACI80P_001472 [Flavobacteriales bacterium]|jgi:uncharacterized protein (DUF2147 family)
MNYSLRMNKKFILTVLAFTFCSMSLLSQGVLGVWKSIDDETGEPKSLVEIYEKDGKLFGKIIKLFREADLDQNPLCIECSDERKDQPILGMEIIRDMEQDGEQWEDGTICDPKSGKVYDCKLWIDKDDSNILNVRGYVYFIYRTQHWDRQ